MAFIKSECFANDIAASVIPTIDFKVMEGVSVKVDISRQEGWDVDQVWIKVTGDHAPFVKKSYESVYRKIKTAVKKVDGAKFSKNPSEVI